MRKLRAVGVILLIVGLMAGGFCLWLSGRYVVPIMMYHSVSEIDRSDTETVDPEKFRWHMEFLRKNGYRVISLNQLVEEIRQGKKNSKKTVVITFDDGLEDNYTVAFPILKEYNYPATFFVPTDLIGTEGHLTWRQLKEMVQHGITPGSHTVGNAYLPDLSEEQQQYEIVDSKKMLEQRLDLEVHFIAYPIGGFTEATKRLVEQAGYKGGLTTNRGHDRLNKDVYELNRVRFGNKDKTETILRTKLSGYNNSFRKLKKPY